MRIIISPAKQMRVDTDSFACKELPVFMDRTEVLMKWIRSLSYEEQKKLWACNDKIARQNAERFAYMDLRKNLTPTVLQIRNMFSPTQQYRERKDNHCEQT